MWVLVGPQPGLGVSHNADMFATAYVSWLICCVMALHGSPDGHFLDCLACFVFSCFKSQGDIAKTICSLAPDWLHSGMIDNIDQLFDRLMWELVPGQMLSRREHWRVLRQWQRGQCYWCLVGRSAVSLHTPPLLKACMGPVWNPKQADVFLKWQRLEKSLRLRQWIVQCHRILDSQGLSLNVALFNGKHVL